MRTAKPVLRRNDRSFAHHVLKVRQLRAFWMNADLPRNGIGEDDVIAVGKLRSGSQRADRTRDPNAGLLRGRRRAGKFAGQHHSRPAGLQFDGTKIGATILPDEKDAMKFWMHDGQMRNVRYELI